VGDVDEEPVSPDQRVCDSVYQMGRVQNVVLQVWRERATIDHVYRTRELVARVHAEYPGQVALLVRVVDGCGFPEPRTTRAFSRLLREVEPEVQGIAVVLEGSGFWAATMRAVISSVTLMARSGPPTRIYSDLREASEALVDLLEQNHAARIPTDTLAAAAIELEAPGREGSPEDGH
jgi:hypothetical protein